MKKFEEFISENTINWLLEDDNPSVKYYTLVDLLEKPFENKDVKTTKEQIMKRGVVQKFYQNRSQEVFGAYRMISMPDPNTRVQFGTL